MTEFHIRVDIKGNELDSPSELNLILNELDIQLPHIARHAAVEVYQVPTDVPNPTKTPRKRAAK